MDNFAFRTATAFIDVPADVVLNIGVAGGNSASVNDTLKNFGVTLQNGNSYIAVANGVLNPANFAANPDAQSTAFTLFLQDQMREDANNSGDVDLRVIHGASDAPTVDVLAGASILVDNASYSNITPYLSVPPAAYVLDITPGNNNAVIVASFAADLSALAGQSAVVLASGFLNPAANQNGPAFTLIGVLANGTVVIFSAPTGLNESNIVSYNLFPNPTTDRVQLNFTENTKQALMLTVTNAIGQEVMNTMIPEGSAQYNFSTSELAKGMYFIRIGNEKGSVSQKLIVQ